jgi:hypothetical protein
MTVDLKAARERLAKFTREHPAWKYTDEVNSYVVTLLTALDQAAEALKPFAAEDIHTGRPDDDPVSRCFLAGEYRRAATVYATLKPADTKEGEG